MVLQATGQTAQRSAYPAANGVDLRQRRLLGGGEGLAPAVRVGSPVLVPDPHGAVNIPGDDVILQPVALPVGDAGESGLQPPEHVLVLIAPRYRVQRTGQQAQHRLLQHVAAAAEVDRYAVAFENIFDGSGVIVQVPGRHGDIPKAAPPAPHQLKDLCGHILHLGEHTLRLHQLHSGAVPPPGPDGTEKALCQMLQGSFRFGGRHGLRFAGNSASGRQPLQPLPRQEALPENLPSAPVSQQRHRH